MTLLTMPVGGFCSFSRLAMSQASAFCDVNPALAMARRTLSRDARTPRTRPPFLPFGPFPIPYGVLGDVLTVEGPDNSYRFQYEFWDGMWRLIESESKSPRAGSLVRAEGHACKRCNDYNEYAAANQSDGTFICFGCRSST